MKTDDNIRYMVLTFTAMLITSGLFLEVCIKVEKFAIKISHGQTWNIYK